MTRDSVPARDLARLLETERRLGERLRSARVEAEALVVRAQADAERCEAAQADQLESDERLLHERLTQERQAQERAINDAAEREITFYRGISPARLATVARRLGDRLLDDEAVP